MIKISDEDRHHTIAVDCSTKGHQKLSFKLGRFVIDATDEEFKGHAGQEEGYSLERGDDAKLFKMKENQNRLAKFVVKSVQTQPLYYSEHSKNIYILVVDVIESSQ